jgi:hypothetical protein
MGVRTFSREEWDAASAAWHEGEFEERIWASARRAAADRGMLYPPAGTQHDDIDAPHPSQRAIVYRAIDETPELLKRVIARSSTWSQVVDELMRSVNARRDEQGEAEMDSGRRAEAARWADRIASPDALAALIAAGQSHRTAQLEAVADAAREVIKHANADDLYSEEGADALLSLEGLLLALGDGQ